MALGEAIAAALDVSRPRIASAQHALHVSIPPHPLVVDGDKVRLSEVVAGPTRRELRAALAALMARAERERRGLRLVEVAGGYQFRTAPEHSEWVRRLFQQRPWRLTRATLETLAIVAYKQPLTRAEIEAIRGVDVDSVIASLLARKLVKIWARGHWSPCCKVPPDSSSRCSVSATWQRCPGSRRSRAPCPKASGREPPVAPKRPGAVMTDRTKGIRLQKLLADSGICSRRAAEVMIRSGRVTVNGTTVKTLGTRALPTDRIRVDDRALPARSHPSAGAQAGWRGDDDP
jgi:hypothetical protein